MFILSLFLAACVGISFLALLAIFACVFSSKLSREEEQQKINKS